MIFTGLDFPYALAGYMAISSAVAADRRSNATIPHGGAEERIHL